MKSTLGNNVLMAVSAAAVQFLTTSTMAQLPTPLSNHFTYQGILKSNGAPFTGTADFQFTLWDTPTFGTPSGSFTVPAMSVSEGSFDVPIDLGSADFNGTTRYLQIAVRTPPGSGTYTTLSPRQKITPTPYSLFAVRARGMWSTADGQNVGIGTSAPTAKLEVRDGDFVLGTSGEQWYFHPRSSFSGDYLQITDNDGGVPQFQRGLVIHQNGRVGIGTAAPGKKLTVAGSMEIGTASGDYQHLRLGGGNSSGFLYGSYPAFGDSIHLGYNYYADSAGSNVIANPGGATSRITMGYGVIKLATGPTGGAPVDVLTMVSNGYVGVGTPTPNNPLHVKTYGTATTAVTGETLSGVAGSAGVYGLATSTGGNISGVYGQCNGAGGFDFYAAGAGVNYGAPSSIRWKRNIELIADPLERLEQMRGVTFDWDAEHGGERDVGFIGEEVGKVLPEVVAYEPDGQFVTGMDYSKVTPLLVEAVKALRAEKDRQLAERDLQIEHQQSEIEDLKSMLRKLLAAQSEGAR